MRRSGVALALAAVLVLTAGVAASLAAPADCGEPLATPRYTGGEKWTWRDEKGTEWNNTVVRVDGDVTQITWPSGSVATYSKDLIVVQVRKTNGELVTRQGAGQYLEIGQKVLDFPLQTGKTWEITYLSTPVGGSMIQHFRRSTILGCEEVQTPAGIFAAFKIEVKQEQAHINWSGVYYWWYAPQVKNRVKRQYVPSRYWHAPRDYELIKFETKYSAHTRACAFCDLAPAAEQWPNSAASDPRGEAKGDAAGFLEDELPRPAPHPGWHDRAGRQW